jgi:hypothetical protein
MGSPPVLESQIKVRKNEETECCHSIRAAKITSILRPSKPDHNEISKPFSNLFLQLSIWTLHNVQIERSLPCPIGRNPLVKIDIARLVAAQNGDPILSNAELHVAPPREQPAFSNKVGFQYVVVASLGRSTKSMPPEVATACIIAPSRTIPLGTLSYRHWMLYDRQASLPIATDTRHLPERRFSRETCSIDAEVDA